VNILIINGPNLNLLGEREPEIYGSESLAEMNGLIRDQNPEDNIEFFQSNHEGEIIDKLHLAKDSVQGVVINPGAFTHYSYAIRDAIQACRLPVVEVHLSNIYAREEFRNKSVTAPACVGIVSGLGKNGYSMAIKALKTN
jgi:3-dehydroquinate dehydratase-2